jgi:hypothetical protein
LRQQRKAANSPNFLGGEGRAEDAIKREVICCSGPENTETHQWHGFTDRTGGIESRLSES